MGGGRQQQAQTWSWWHDINKKATTPDVASIDNLILNNKDFKQCIYISFQTT
jgi:hypothetical protein